MDLESLNSPLPKAWLNIKANSITTAATFSNPTFTNVTTTGQTLSASQFVDALVWTNGADITVGAPSATELKSYFLGDLVDGLTFTTNVYKNSAFNTIINFGAGTTLYGGVLTAMLLSSASGYTRAELTYRYSGGVWIIFYSLSFNAPIS